MRIDIIGRGIDITDAIREHAAEKASKLTRYFDHIQAITLNCTRPDHSHHASFNVELIIDIEHHKDMVCNAQGDDLYLAIDGVVQKGSRMLAEYKDKLKTEKR